MVSPQCSVLREAFSTFEMRARISSFHYFSVFQSRPSRQDIENFCLSVMCKCWRRGLKPHKIVLHDNHHTSIIIRTLNISERTQTFTTVSVASKFQTWTLLTILFGLLRLVSYANITRSQSTNMEWYKMIQKTVTKAKRVRNHITDQKSGKISNQSHNRWRSALSLAVAGRRAMEKFATLSWWFYDFQNWWLWSTLR